MFKAVSPLIPTHRLLLFINGFRVTVVMSLIVLSLLLNITGVSIVQGFWFYLWVGCYSIIILMTAVNPYIQIEQNRPLSVSGVLDIIMMIIFMHLCGGIETGYGILVLPFIATSSLLSSGKMYLAYGAIATISIFISIFWGNLEPNIAPDQIWQDIFKGGLLSLACLFVSAVTSILSRTARYAINLATLHEEEIANLNRLNELALKELSDAVIVLDKSGVIQQFNAQAKIYFPFLNHGTTPQMFAPFIDKWQQQPDHTFEIDTEINKQNMIGRAVPVTNSDMPILLLFLRSSSDFATEAHKIKLESLGRLTANIAHEIRNPLSAVRQASELLAESIPVSDEQLTNMITNNVARIDRLVEEVLVFSKKDRINQEWIDLKSFFSNILDEFIIAHPEAEGCIQLRLDQRAEGIIFDKGHLIQIVWNLCNNAWRHSKKNLQAMAISVSWQSENTTNLFFYDNGGGVPEKIQNNLFEPFFTTEKHGTGLGLYIGRELAHANGAELTYNAEKKCFVLTCKAKSYDANS